MSKLLFLMAIAAGFLVGSRSGRNRAEQVAGLARDLVEHPVVQSTAGALQGRFKR